MMHDLLVHIEYCKTMGNRLLTVWCLIELNILRDYQKKSVINNVCMTYFAKSSNNDIYPATMPLLQALNLQATK